MLLKLRVFNRFIVQSLAVQGGPEKRTRRLIFATTYISWKLI